MANKKPALTRKTLHLIAAYNQLPDEGRAALDRLAECLAEIGGRHEVYRVTKRKPGVKIREL
jgi:hypothetical protein